MESYRLITAPEGAGWTAEEILRLIKYIGSGQDSPEDKREG